LPYVVILFILFVIQPVLFLKPLSLKYVSFTLMIVLIYFIVTTILSMVFVYISELHTEMHTTNRENVKLLDGMHEGLLILSKSNQKVMFCNSPAEKLIKNFLRKQNEPKESFLGSEVFIPVKLSERLK